MKTKPLTIAQRRQLIALEEGRDLAKEALEIKGIAARTDLICNYCKKQPTTANGRTGEIRPCKKCRHKQIVLAKYKISLRTFATMLSQQGYRCAICGIHFDYQTRQTSPSVDHCHDLNHVRGVLCNKCNLGLGNFSDNIETLEFAIKYLTFNRLVRQWWLAKEAKM